MRAEREIRTTLVILLVATLCSLPAAAASYESSLRGSEPSPAGERMNRVSFEAEGTLPGVVAVEIRRASSSSVEGVFTMTVVDSSANRRTVGTLTGTMTGTITTRGADLASAMDMVLTVTGGSGQFEAAHGAGTLKVSATDGPEMTGTLSLNF